MILLPGCSCCISPGPVAPCEAASFCTYSLDAKSPFETDSQFDNCDPYGDSDYQLAQPPDAPVVLAEGGWTQDQESLVTCAVLGEVPSNIFSWSRAQNDLEGSYSYYQRNGFFRCLPPVEGALLGQTETAECTINASIRVESYRDGDKWLVTLGLSVTIGTYTFEGDYGFGGNPILRTGTATFSGSHQATLPCECIEANERECSVPTGDLLFCHAQTPSTISFSMNGTSLGEWPSPSESELFFGQVGEATAQQLKDQLSQITFEFELVSTDSCNPAP